MHPLSKVASFELAIPACFPCVYVWTSLISSTLTLFRPTMPLRRVTTLLLIKAVSKHSARQRMIQKCYSVLPLQQQRVLASAEEIESVKANALCVQPSLSSLQRVDWKALASVKSSVVTVQTFRVSWETQTIRFVLVFESHKSHLELFLWFSENIFQMTVAAMHFTFCTPTRYPLPCSTIVFHVDMSFIVQPESGRIEFTVETSKHSNEL